MIAIDGLNVPKSCCDCNFWMVEKCIVNGRRISSIHDRPDWCPIHDVVHLRQLAVVDKSYGDVTLLYALDEAKKAFAEQIGKITTCKKCEHLDEYYQPMDDLIEYRFDVYVADMRSKASPTCCQPAKQSGASVEDMT